MAATLEELYTTMRTLRGLNKPIDDILEELNKLEEDIIKNEILPIVEDKIEPVLKRVQRDLVLVVDYHPDEPISVSLSRKSNIRQIIDDAKLLEIDPDVEHRYGGKRTKKVENKKSKTVLKVTFPDGTVFFDKAASNTFAKTIEKIGCMRVRQLGLTYCKVPIVSNKKDKKYEKAQIPTKDGLFIMTHSNTEDKKKMLDKISEELGLRLKVEIV